VSVPSSELAPPAPSPASECVPRWNQGGQHLLAGEGRGEPTRTNGEKAWHSVYSVVLTIQGRGRSPGGSGRRP
jgi:hypothetical protein